MGSRDLIHNGQTNLMESTMIEPVEGEIKSRMPPLFTSLSSLNMKEKRSKLHRAKAGNKNRLGRTAGLAKEVGVDALQLNLEWCKEKMLSFSGGNNDFKEMQKAH
ncbi:OLC1v1036427C1 [Oldenlandia corymbosa var. corymbosa]|uniref:OLC1v1036427C1 n=1 Tax=Oldenlandia corymbosa var. corymbosa TaxID=529605 RepID=A0AAV1CV82_OLDCO|nr:OLC1v1036427C1 [Oldenlandia corymbosa var. corymbosa]